ncbi:hypothetical protein Aut01nite_41850 [Actinoplanes utahensis]|nr:hypothetical protein Aut01nite_41850 [Actinoplanes utahensis]
MPAWLCGIMPPVGIPVDGGPHSRGMATVDKTFDVVEIDSSLQRVIRRKRLFVAVPIAAGVLAFLMVVWEVIRQNVPDGYLKRWPWKLELLNLESGATVLTVLIVVVFTRMQYAETVRPSIGWTMGPVRSEAERSSAAYWLSDIRHMMIVNVFNGGGGGAVLVGVHYRVALSTQEHTSGWIDHAELYELLDSFGMARGDGFYCSLLRAGLPVPPGTSLLDRNLIAMMMSRECLRRLRILDIRLRFSDPVGDLHERVLACRFNFVDEHDYDGVEDGSPPESHPERRPVQQGGRLRALLAMPAGRRAARQRSSTNR